MMGMGSERAARSLARSLTENEISFSGWLLPTLHLDLTLARKEEAGKEGTNETDGLSEPRS